MSPKRKRAPGGGRRPSGAFLSSRRRFRSACRLRCEKSWRLPPKRAARAWVRNCYVAYRISSTAIETRLATQPCKRSVSYRQNSTHKQTAGLNKATHRELHWRTNPFYFRAFKIAVGKLLDALEPKGKIEPPIEMQFNIPEEAGALEYDFLKSFRDPESRGAYAARSIWASLRNIPLHTREEDEATKKRLRERSEAAYLRELYGMPNAARDLQIEIEEDKA